MSRLTRAQAIRQKCLDCTCWQSAEVAHCDIKTCPLWNYRMGYEVDDTGSRFSPKTPKA